MKCGNKHQRKELNEWKGMLLGNGNSHLLQSTSIKYRTLYFMQIISIKLSLKGDELNLKRKNMLGAQRATGSTSLYRIKESFIKRKKQPFEESLEIKMR